MSKDAGKNDTGQNDAGHDDAKLGGKTVTLIYQKVASNWSPLYERTVVLGTDLGASYQEWKIALLEREKAIALQMLACENILDEYEDPSADPATAAANDQAIRRVLDADDQAEIVHRAAMPEFFADITNLHILAKAQQSEMLDALRELCQGLIREVATEVMKVGRSSRTDMMGCLYRHAIMSVFKSTLSEVSVDAAMQAALADEAWLLAITTRLDKLAKPAKDKAQEVFAAATDKFDTVAASNLEENQQAWLNIRQQSNRLDKQFMERLIREGEVRRINDMPMES